MNFISNFNWRPTLSGIALSLLLATGCAQRHNTLSEQEIADGWAAALRRQDARRVERLQRRLAHHALARGRRLHPGARRRQRPVGLHRHPQAVRKLHPRLGLETLLRRQQRNALPRGRDPYFKVPYVTGPEYQLIDEAGWEETNAPTKLEPWQRLGVDYAMHLPDAAKMRLNPQGEWNNSRIVCDNGHVEHWLNGEKILEFDAYTDEWFALKNSGKWADAPEYGLARRGVICLQDHGYPASFRNVKIKELPRKAGRTVELFNGRDLTGWEKYGTELWYVDDAGNLVSESGPDQKYGYLATREYYDDFDLTVEFKQVANGNSGLFFRSFVEPPVKVHGWQCEVAPRNHDTAGIYESYGRGWLQTIPDEKESILKEGEWNTLRLRVEGDRVQTWLNGEPMVDFRDAKIGAAQGRIALQIHDGGGIKVLWRNFRLETL